MPLWIATKHWFYAEMGSWFLRKEEPIQSSPLRNSQKPFNLFLISVRRKRLTAKSLLAKIRVVVVGTKEKKDLKGDIDWGAEQDPLLEGGCTKTSNCNFCYGRIRSLSVEKAAYNSKLL